jgi:hypothetical protein
VLGAAAQEGERQEGFALAGNDTLPQQGRWPAVLKSGHGSSPSRREPQAAPEPSHAAQLGS